MKEIEKSSIKTLSQGSREQWEVILTMLLNKNDELRYEISNWKEKYQKLSDELNKLKGEQGTAIYQTANGGQGG